MEQQLEIKKVLSLFSVIGPIQLRFGCIEEYDIKKNILILYHLCSLCTCCIMNFALNDDGMALLEFNYSRVASYELNAPSPELNVTPPSMSRVSCRV